MAKGEIKLKVSVEGLSALDAFLDKHGDKVKLVGSFELKPGDIVFFKLTEEITNAVAVEIAKSLEQGLPDIQTILLPACLDLVGAGKNGSPLDGYVDITTMDDDAKGRRVFQKASEE